MFTLFRWFRRLLYLAVGVAIAYLVVTGVQVLTASRAPSVPGAVDRASAIVVVADAAPGQKKAPSSDLAARCNHALELRTAHKSALVIVVAPSGRASKTSRNESAVAVAYLESRKVPARSIRAVVGGDVPAGLRVVASRFPAKRHDSVIIVGDSVQTLWLEHVARAVGLKAQMSPSSPHLSVLQKIGGIAIQAAAVAWGHLFGFGETGWIAG
ncbi:MAG: hypothetical protein ACRDZP_07550 [Acidimicrobiales bacterium]